MCDCSDVYILVKRTIADPNMGAAGAAGNNTNKKVVFKNCAPFNSCITEISITQIMDYAKDVDIVMPMYNLIEYSSAYSKTSISSW